MNAALIELWIDPRAVERVDGLSYSDSLTRALRLDPGRREAQARAACGQAIKAGAETIVFPGWAVVGTFPPSWILRASQGRTIVCECLHPGSQGGKRRVPEEEWPTWETFVVRDEEVRVRGTQRLAQGHERTDYGEDLVRDIEAKKRSDRGATLWICGETELLAGGGGRKSGGSIPVRNESGKDDRVLRSGGIIFNPAHTPARPQASRDKRAWLSVGGWLLHTANIHPGDWKYFEYDRASKKVVPFKARSAFRAAAAWRNGDQLKTSDGLRRERLFVGSDQSCLLWVNV
jgi:hypothetical protein